MIQPPLTKADRSSMALQALQNQRRPEQHIEVTFDRDPDLDDPGQAEPTRVPRTPDEIAPPADSNGPEPHDEVPGSSPSSSGDRVK
jgi:hypothetical protein